MRQSCEEMTFSNKRTYNAMIAALLLAAVAFCVLWQRALHDNSDVEAIAQAGAAEAYRQFAAYQEEGREGDYWAGVAAYSSFQRAYGSLALNTDKSANYAFCNEVYGSLLYSPERSKEHISELVGVMKLLSENVLDERGYSRMSELRNALK